MLEVISTYSYLIK